MLSQVQAIRNLSILCDVQVGFQRGAFIQGLKIGVIEYNDPFQNHKDINSN
jgi:hypothetical protein